MLKQKSLSRNALIYTIKVVTSMIFPLITFPYISRILLAEGVGKYNFSYTYISYFQLLASLGISTYAIREGAKIRDDNVRLNNFAQEIFSINILSTMISMILLFVSLICVPSLNAYRNIICILSISIPMITIGTEWIFSGKEEFTFITIRTILFQILSLSLMFLFVKNKNDVCAYGLISVIATAGANITNFFYARKYFDHKIVISSNLKKHLKSILILFVAVVASQIYVNIDITMLGFIKGDYATGIYSASSKIYNIVRSLLTAFIAVILPRLANILVTESKIQYEKLLKKILNAFLILVLPSALGLILLAKSAVILLSGKSFEAAVLPLRILSIALVFSVIGSFIANSILIVFSEERKILYATIVGAIVNVILNVYFIEKYSFIGAAVTTLISEMIVFLIQLYYARKCCKIGLKRDDLLKEIISIVIMTGCYKITKQIELSNFFMFFLEIVVCALTYLLSLVLLKNSVAMKYFGLVFRYIRRRDKNENQ